MCIQCAAGAMTAVAGASGGRIWLQARVPALAHPRTRKIVHRTIMGLGVLAAGVLGPSAGTGSGVSPAAAAAPPALSQPAGR
ncbi:hypothetical protein [Patulibacter sp.]|uniref:hypothetical protein n=1 Tax=Patulibacter sp. TaxID=1912859 RepID=UPI00271A17C5|nr:hypothetical protein [Patulibacter sp.]MDO9410491.1 hypothetical protein [Patulibacter sp.]